MPSKNYITLPPVDFVKLIKRGKTYTIRFSHPNVKDGQRVSFSLGAISESEAKKKQIDIRDEVVDFRFKLERYSKKEAKAIQGTAYGLSMHIFGSNFKPKPIATLKDVLDNFKKRRNKELSPTTIKNHQRPLDRFLEANPELNDIDNYAALIPALKSKYSVTTIVGMWDSYLSRALHFAELDELNIPKNNYRQQFGLLQLEKPAPKPKDCYTYHEIENIILPRLEQHLSVESVIYKAICINYLLGLRPSENLGLTGDCIQDNLVTIKQVKPRGSNTLYRKTKTKKPRTFAVPPQVQLILESLPHNGFIYRHKGKPLSQRTVTFAWNKVLDELVSEGRLTRKLPFKTLRHSFINHQLYKPNPLSPVETSAIVGNKPSTIESNYLVERVLSVSY